jgi:hypothetical protein
MIRRRSFLIGCSGVVAAPVFAHLALATTATRELQGAADDAAASTALPAAGASAQNIVLRIDGWDTAADSGDGVWVQINSSWRATWR